MSESYSRNPESQERYVTITADDARKIMRSAIQDAAFPVGAGEPMKAWMARVARAVGLTAARLYDIYIGETIPRWHEGARILAEAAERRRIKDLWHDIAARAEISALEVQYERLASNGAHFIDRRAVASGQAASPDQARFGFCEEAPDLD